MTGPGWWVRIKIVRIRPSKKNLTLEAIKTVFALSNSYKFESADSEHAYKISFVMHTLSMCMSTYSVYFVVTSLKSYFSIKKIRNLKHCEIKPNTSQNKSFKRMFYILSSWALSKPQTNIFSKTV